MIREWFQGKKTYLLAAIGVLTGLAELFGIDVLPDVTEANALNYIWASLGLATLRAGVGNKPKDDAPMGGGMSGV